MTKLVEAASFDTRVQADLGRLYLASRGVESGLFDADVHSVYGSLGGLFMAVRLMVTEEDLDEARRALMDYEP